MTSRHLNRAQFLLYRLSKLFTIGLTLALVSAATPAQANSTKSPYEQYVELLKLLDTGDVAQDKQHISYLMNFPIQESVEALLQRLDAEAFRIATGREYSIHIMEVILVSVGNLGNSEWSEYLEIAEMEVLDALPEDHEKREELRSAFKDSINLLKANHSPLKTLEELFPEEAARRKALAAGREGGNYFRKNSMTAKAWTEEIERKLEYAVKGQPEVVQGFVDLELSDSIYGYRRLPVIKVLMGAPGTGKDTTAEAYTDAIHNQKDAYLEHMFRLPVIKNSADLWQVLGSATGYVGSDQFPPFLKFLVEHSGGRYFLKEEEGPRGIQTSIHQDKNWKEGQNIEGKLPPESAVVFVNEFHNWSKKSKDDFLKQALEKGIFEVNNPNGGLDKIYVPVTFVIATNEGLELVTSREVNGNRFGKPLNYPEMLEKWETYHKDVPSLKASILASNERGANGTQEAYGISEELLNRLPNSSLHLMRPQSPEILQEIAEIKLNIFRYRLANAKGEFGKVEVSWDGDMPRFLQEFQYVPEDNARPIQDKVTNLIEATIFKAFKDELIPNNDKPKKLHVKIVTNENYTSDLLVDVEIDGEKKEQLRLPILATESEKARAPLTDEALKDLIALDEQMKRQLFGVDAVIDRLAKAELESAEGRNGVLDISQAKHPAKSYMFLGLSSTGKTETAKVLAETRYGSRAALVTIDFSQVQSVHDLKVKILGSTDGAGKPIASDFMKHYDRNQGRLVFVFDEIANTPLETLKALYDIFREPVVTTFSDGKDRIMGNTTIILTGNAGEEWYADLPKDLPEWMLMTAMSDIYERMMRSPGLQRATLERYFSPAFVNRLGMRNIFFFPPLNHKAIRQLTMLKTKMAVDELRGNDSVRGWNVQFPSKRNFLDLVDAFEREGFILSEQGAAIDRFVKEDFAAELRVLLLKHQVPSGTTVVVGLHPETGYIKEPGQKAQINLSIFPEGAHSPLILTIEGKLQPRKLKKSPTSKMLTAYHEAGHELVGKFYLGDVRQTEVISITSGVAQIEGHFVPYDGIVESRPTEILDENRQVMLRELAGLFGGEVAQTLVTKGRRNDSGKSNDMERAAKWARSMIISQGLSPEWGLETIPHGQSEESYIKSLSEDRKQLLSKIVRKTLDESRKLAEKALIANYDHMIDLGMALARAGELDREALDKFYEGRKVVTEKSYSTWNYRVAKNRVKYAIQGLYRASTRDAQLLPWVPTSDVIAESVETFHENKFDQIKGVRVMEEIPILSDRKTWAAATSYFENIKALPGPCEELLTPKGD